MHLIDQAGAIAAMRHCNARDDENGNYEEKLNNEKFVALARIDRVDFQQPVYVGEVTELQAEVTYTSPRSVEVKIKVFADDLHGIDFYSISLFY